MCYPPIESPPLPQPRPKEDALWTACSNALKPWKMRCASCSGGCDGGGSSRGLCLVLALVCLLQPWGLAAQAPGEGQDRTLWQLVNLWRRVGVLERTLTHVTSVTGAGGLPEVGSRGRTCAW